jgi:hypothetical protein
LGSALRRGRLQAGHRAGAGTCAIGARQWGQEADMDRWGRGAETLARKVGGPNAAWHPCWLEPGGGVTGASGRGGSPGAAASHRLTWVDELPRKGADGLPFD